MNSYDTPISLSQSIELRTGLGLGDDAKVRQLARISIYTWELTNLPVKERSL